MKLFKKVIAVLAIATMSLTMVACGNSKAATEMASQDEKGLIVARVGEVPIYKTALDNQMAVYGMSDEMMKTYYGEDFTSDEQTVNQYNDFKKNIVNSLVESEILVLKAKETKGIEVTEDKINEELEATKAGFAKEEDFTAALEQSGMTLDDLKENIAKNLYVTQLLDQYKQEKAKVTEEDIQKYYDENIINYTTKPGAQIYHILVDSEEKANEVLGKYNDGTSFSDLAAEYGTDGTKDKGGALGFIEYDTTQYDQDFMAGAKELGEGEVSKPVKTQFGWHIIKADGIQKDEKVQPLEEVKESITTVLQNQKAEELLTADIEEWKKDYEITYYEENYKTELTQPKETTTEGTDAKEEATENTTTDAKDDQSADASKDAAADTGAESTEGQTADAK